MRSICQDSLANGWRNFKIKVGGDINDDFRRSDIIRSEIGDDCNLMMDAIKDGQRIVDDYVWQHDDKPLPANHELVIYELLISDFFHNGENGNLGSYQTVIQKLDYLQDLGINADETGKELMTLQLAGLDAAFNVRCFVVPADTLNSWNSLSRQLILLTKLELQKTPRQVYSQQQVIIQLILID